jgi:hypothetical protein
LTGFNKPVRFRFKHAAASVYELDALISWNLKQLAIYKTTKTLTRLFSFFQIQWATTTELPLQTIDDGRGVGGVAPDYW